jgi:hypothetical protein
LDNDPRTPDNIVLFSVQAQNKIKAIYGHYLIPHERKELDRSFYTAVPTRAEGVATDPQLKKNLKQWYRKNPTPELQRKSPFASFVPDVSAFQYVRNELGRFFTHWNCVIRSKTNPRGNISAQHYMTIIQKITTYIYQNCLLYMFSIPPNYNWKDDPEHLKSKAAQTLALKKMKEMVRTNSPDTYTYLTEFIGTVANLNFINSTGLP